MRTILFTSPKKKKKRMFLTSVWCETLISRLVKKKIIEYFPLYFLYVLLKNEMSQIVISCKTLKCHESMSVSDYFSFFLALLREYACEF